MLQPINNNILFQFIDLVSNGHFIDTDSSGIIVDAGKNHKHSTNYSRVANVVAVGPDVKLCKKGDQIVIKTLMWTDSAVIIDGQKLWMTNEKQILGTVN